MATNSGNEIRESLNIMRGLMNGPTRLVEDASSNDGDGVPYGNDDELYKNTLSAARTQFGADFTGCEHPMLYYPSNGDVVFSGRIPTLNDAKFQFHYLDASQGCYIWVENLALTEDSISTINKIWGVFKNWQNELKTSADIKPMEFKKEERIPIAP